MNGPMGVVPAGHRLTTIAAEPDLWRPLDVLCSSVWPELMLHNPVAFAHWDLLRTDWPGYQIALLDSTGRAVAGANAAPVSWDGTDEDLSAGWDDQFERSAADLEAPISIDLAADRGVYYGPNVWMVHKTA